VIGRNYIASNRWGIYVDDAFGGHITNNGGSGIANIGPGAHGNIIGTNLIGLDRTGTHAVPNTWGILLTDSASNTIVANVISGNRQDGVRLTSATGNLLRQNLIGTDLAGRVSIPNVYNGVYIVNAPKNEVSFNLISGNGDNGVTIFGTNDRGIYLTNSLGNVIGGTNQSARNVISGNRNAGVGLTLSQSNLVAGNYIGTDARGLTAVPNSNGIHLFESSFNNLGGDQVAMRNVISGNQFAGVTTAHAHDE
jgi:parallel beta-helix repeat protein